MVGWLKTGVRDFSSRVTPFALLDALQREFGPETVYTADSGNGTFLAMECLRLERLAFPLLLILGEDLHGLHAEFFCRKQGVVQPAGDGEMGAEHLV